VTTPHERKRNLIWGREMLEELLADTTVPPAWSTEAAGLLGQYPESSTLQDCGDDGLEGLQMKHARVLAAARDLFQRLRGSRACSEQRRYTLLVILRHFY
jgi:hypothetical protein